MKHFAVVATLVGGVLGAGLASPETYTVADHLPGVGLHRQCSSQDMVCDSIRSRELDSGVGWVYSTYVNEEETFNKRITFGGIGAVGLGVPAFLITQVVSKKKKSTE